MLSPKVLEVIVCPQCRGKLQERADHSALVCRHCALAYPVRNGIPILLASDAVREV